MGIYYAINSVRVVEIRKNYPSLLLRGTLILIAVVVLALCVLVLPHGLVSVGGYAPIVVGMYIAAIPFFIALYKSWQLLNHIDQGKAFSQSSANALKHIKYCAVLISTLYAVGLPYIFYVADLDDAPGVVAITLVIIFASFVIATFAGLLERLLQNVIDIKSENELTV
jgi:Ni/Fe-hydrogenase subunit HybB-like protein